MEDSAMKKTLSFILAILMLFSTCSVLAFADDEEIPDGMFAITFADYDGRVIETRYVAAGNRVKAPENPTRASVESQDNLYRYDYTFKGWSADSGKTLYHQNTIPEATENVIYYAVYSEQRSEIKPLTLMKLIQSIFARINAIFEYFSRIFTKPEKP